MRIIISIQVMVVCALGLIGCKPKPTPEQQRQQAERQRQQEERWRKTKEFAAQRAAQEAERHLQIV